MAGTQDAVAKSAGKRLWRANQAVAAAEKAPYTGSATAKALSDAKDEQTKAEAAFNQAYAAYADSMRRSHQSPDDPSTFITQ